MSIFSPLIARHVVFYFLHFMRFFRRDLTIHGLDTDSCFTYRALAKYPLFELILSRGLQEENDFGVMVSFNDQKPVPTIIRSHTQLAKIFR